MAAKRPTGLKRSGRALWRAIAENYDLRPDELRLLEDACRETDLIAALDEALHEEDSELVVKGSMGQPVANPLVQELRQHRGVLQRLLGSLKLPDEGGAGEGTSSSALRAAEARWTKRGA